MATSGLSKKIGRPVKPAIGPQRAQVITLLRLELRRELEAAAAANGRTLSQEMEAWVEELKFYRTTFERMKQTAVEIDRGSFAAALQRAGLRHQPLLDARRGVSYDAWYAAGHPHLLPQGFVAPREGEYLGDPVEVPPPEPLNPEQAATNFRNWAEAFHALEQRVARLETKEIDQ